MEYICLAHGLGSYTYFEYHLYRIWILDVLSKPAKQKKKRVELIVFSTTSHNFVSLPGLSGLT